MIALLTVGCLGADGWRGPTEPQPLEQACTSWTYGQQAGDQLGAAVAVLGDFDDPPDLVPEIAASKPSGGRLDHLLVLDGRGDGSPMGADEARLNLVGPDDAAGVDAVVPTFAYGGGSLALGFASGGVDGEGIVYAIPQELLESEPEGEVTSEAFGPAWVGGAAGSRLGAHVLAPPALEGGPALVLAAPAKPNVGGAVWLVYDWESAGTPPADIRDVGVKVSPVYATQAQGNADLVVPGADGAAVLLVSSGIGLGGASTVYGVVNPPQSGEQSLSDANFHIEGEPGDVFGDAMVNLADLDGDEHADFAVRGSGAWYVSFGVPAGDAIDARDLPLRLPFTAAEPSADLRCSGLSVGDYDGDETLDLAIGVCPAGSDGAAHVLLGSGWGPGVVDPVAEADLVLLGVGSGGAAALASAPLDGGGDALVVGDWTWSSLGQAEQGSVFMCDVRDAFSP